MRASPDQLPLLLEAGPATVRGADWGGMRMAVVSVPAGTDFGPLLRGLPGDVCPSPHWGYIASGRLRVEYPDGTGETIRAGEVCYLPPGHTGVAEEDLVFIELSPPGEHDRFLESARENLAASA